MRLATTRTGRAPRPLDMLAGEARVWCATAAAAPGTGRVRQSNSRTRNVAYHYPGFVCHARWRVS